MFDRTKDEPVAPASRAGASEADLAALYPQWYPRLLRYFVGACGCSEALAHELVQDSFAAALRGLAGFRGEAQLSTWLWQIAGNTLRAHLRRQQPLQLGAEPPPEAETQDLAPGLGAALSFSESTHLNDLSDCVQRAFRRFQAQEPERAEVLYLAYVEGWTRAELAQRLGRSEHATTVYLAQCRAKLLPLMQDCHDC
ncbi:MAG: hypothetical protein CFE41_09005 [Burkholderiales bacterium PBB2]|nr:sigma-70 family RNA polymerase sigma factor [Roseateles sp.]OYU27869.1 MAG: hypothetical protein CFE41_09005 [Burkholderiales bacterium PBB2]